MKPRERLARLHFVNTVLHQLTGHDLYLASQVLAGIEQAAEHQGDAASPTVFSGMIGQVHESLTGRRPDTGFTYLECVSPEAPGPLWVREYLLQALAAQADAPRAMVMIGNAAGADDSPVTVYGRRHRSRARRRAAEYAATIEELRHLAARRANPRSLITLLFV